MPDIVCDTSALEEARTVIAGEARRMPGLGDRLRATPMPDAGGLDASRAVADAIAAVTRALVAELEVAGRRLGEADRALDATTRLVQETDRAGADALTPAGR